MTTAYTMPMDTLIGSTPNQSSLTDAHKTLVSLMVIAVVMIFLVEIAGIGPQWGTVITLMLVGIVLGLAMTQSTRLSTFSSQYPWQP